jgi:hypothetical protein
MEDKQVAELQTRINELELELKKAYAFLGVIHGNDKEAIAAIRLPTARSRDRSTECHWRVYLPPSEGDYRFKLLIGEASDGSLKSASVVENGELEITGKGNGMDATVRCYWNEEKLSFFLDSELMKSSANCSIKSENFDFLRSTCQLEAPGLITYFEGQLSGEPACETEQKGLRLFQLQGFDVEDGKPNTLEMWIERK